MKIMSNRSYDAICDIVMDQSKKLEAKDVEIITLHKTIDYLGDSIKKQDNTIKFLKGLLAHNGITYVITDIDFPATKKEY